MKHFWNAAETTALSEYAVKQPNGHVYPEMGSQRIYRFPNGFGASVVRHESSYGGRQGLFELAVLDNTGDITYSTTITSDVLGWLTIEDVDDILDRISKYPPTHKLA